MSFLSNIKSTFFAVLATSVTTATLAQSFNVQNFGNFKQMMQSGNTAAQVKLKDIAQAKGTWGVGALAGLKGEIILVDGKMLVTPGSDAQGKTNASQPTDEAVLWASAQVAQWQEVTVPKNMSQAEFEAFVVQQAKVLNLNLDLAFPYRVQGSYTHLIWHVVTGEKETGSAHQQQGHSAPAGQSGHANSQANTQSGQKVFRNPTLTGNLVGMYSGKALEGVISHPGERFHAHYTDAALSVSGHVDQYNVQADSVVFLPVR
jgi:alpha-acetolactate decarboxylase